MARCNKCEICGEQIDHGDFCDKLHPSSDGFCDDCGGYFCDFCCPAELDEDE